jgi:glycosyltransferase involved in cell wall biosynthesis
MNIRNTNIFMITDSLGFNGWGEYTKSHVEILLRDTDFNFIIFYKSNNSFCEKNRSLFKDRLLFIKLSGIYLMDFIILSLFSLFLKPHIVHFMSEPIAKFISAIKVKSRFIQTIHGTYGDLFLGKYKKYLKLYDLVIFDSDFTKKYFDLPIRKSHQYVLFPFSTTLLRIENEVNQRRFKKINQLIFVGNSKDRKGLNLVLDMYLFLKKEVSDLRLVIVGNLNSFHLNFIKNESNIFYFKNLSITELIEQIKISKVNILPSINAKIENRLHFEGYGLVHVESIKLGTPSIGCLDTGNESFLKNGINGFLINQNNLDELILATRNFINKEEENDFFLSVKNSIDSISSNVYSKEIIKLYGI